MDEDNECSNGAEGAIGAGTTAECNMSEDEPEMDEEGPEVDEVDEEDEEDEEDEDVEEPEADKTRFRHSLYSLVSCSFVFAN